MSGVLVVGSFVQDLAFRTEVFPAPGETRVGSFFAGPGGKGFNQAVASHRQGVPTKFIGAVGSDIFAEGLQAFVKHEGINAALLEISNATTGAASIVVNKDGQNQIIVSLGANDYLTSNFVDLNFGSPSVVLVQVESNIQAARLALEKGRKSGAITILNPAPINDLLTADLLSLSDVITPNETEFIFLFKHLLKQSVSDNFWTIEDRALHELCRKLTVSTVVLTLGDKGCFVSQIDTFYRVSPIKINLIDSTGAGDAFSGGLAAGLVKFSGDLKQSVKFATVVAGLSTQRAGTAPAMPSCEEVRARFENEYF